MPERGPTTRWARGISVQLYAGGMGIVLAALGLGGLLGLWHVRTGGIILYLVTAVALSYVSFSRWTRGECRLVVGGLGALYFLSGCLLLVAYDLPVIPADYYDLYHSIVRLSIGTLSILAAYYLPDHTPARSVAAEEHPGNPS